MSEFQIDDMYWSIDLWMEAGTVFCNRGDGYGIMHDSNHDRKRRAIGKTKEECINNMIAQLEKLRDYESEY